MVKEDSDEEEPTNYFALGSSANSNNKKKEDSVTGTIEAKLDFKKFREFREVSSIKETYKFRRVLGEGAFGIVYEAMHN